MKKGKISWETLAIIVLALAVLVVMMLFSKGIRDKIIEAWREFFGMLIGRRI